MKFWNIYLDASGFFNRSKPSPTITSCGIAIPRDNIDEMRRQLANVTSKKWSDSRKRERNAISDFICNLSCQTALAVIRTNTRTLHWKNFFRQTNHGRIEKVRTDLARAMIVEEGSIVIPHCLKLYGPGIVTDSDGYRSIWVNLTMDSDVNNRDAIQICIDSKRDLSRILKRQHRIKVEIETNIQTEQDEPLLLLADHVAGAFQRSKSDLIARYHRALGKKLYEKTVDFDHELPDMDQGRHP